MSHKHTFAGDTLPLIVGGLVVLFFGAILLGTIVSSCRQAPVMPGEAVKTA